MNDELILSLPADATEATAAEIAKALEGVVARTRVKQERMIDLATIKMILEVAGTAVGTATAVWTFIDKVRTALRAKGVKGAAVTLPNGARVDLDHATAKSVAALLEARAG